MDLAPVSTFHVSLRRRKPDREDLLGGRFSWKRSYGLYFKRPNSALAAASLARPVRVRTRGARKLRFPLSTKPAFSSARTALSTELRDNLARRHSSITEISRPFPSRVASTPKTDRSPGRPDRAIDHECGERIALGLGGHVHRSGRLVAAGLPTVQRLYRTLSHLPMCFSMSSGIVVYSISSIGSGGARPGHGGVCSWRSESGVLSKPSDFYFHSQSFMWVFPFSSHSYSYTAGVFRRRVNFEDAFWKYKAPRQLVTLPRPDCHPRP